MDCGGFLGCIGWEGCGRHPRIEVEFGWLPNWAERCFSAVELSHRTVGAQFRLIPERFAVGRWLPQRYDGNCIDVVEIASRGHGVLFSLEKLRSMEADWNTVGNHTLKG